MRSKHTHRIAPQMATRRVGVEYGTACENCPIYVWGADFCKCPLELSDDEARILEGDRILGDLLRGIQPRGYNS